MPILLIQFNQHELAYALLRLIREYNGWCNTTGSFPESPMPGIKSLGVVQYDEHPVEYTDLFDTTQSTRTRRVCPATGFGLAPRNATRFLAFLTTLKFKVS